MFNNTKLIAVPALMGALFLAASGTQAHASDLDDASVPVTLNVQDFTSVTTSTSAIDMQPEITDFQAGEFEASGTIDLAVETNSTAGCTVNATATVAGQHQVAPGDIYLKLDTDSAYPSTGLSASTGTSVWSNDGATLDSTDPTKLKAKDVSLNVKIGNLGAYTADAGADTPYTSTITFTTVAN